MNAPIRNLEPARRVTSGPLLDDPSATVDSTYQAEEDDLMKLLNALQARRCRLRGHLFWPEPGRRQYAPVEVRCDRCKTTEVFLPYGECASGHPIADHFTADGTWDESVTWRE